MNVQGHHGLGTIFRSVLCVSNIINTGPYYSFPNLACFFRDTLFVTDSVIVITIRHVQTIMFKKCMTGSYSSTVATKLLITELKTGRQ